MKTKTRLLPLGIILTALINALGQSAISQPKSQAVILYQPAAFGVIASGTAPLGYQWRKDGVPIAGASNDQIVFAQSRFSDTGLYSVVVSNAEGSVTSADAILMVNSPKGGDLDYSFAWGGSVYEELVVWSIAVQPDGKVLAGYFSRMKGSADRGGIARLNVDGTTDHTFWNQISGSEPIVFAVEVQSDGKVLIGGAFDTVNGVSRNNIARLNADGTLDSGFQNGLSGISGSQCSVRSVAVQSDGKVLIGGWFSAVNGESRNNLARLNVDGTLDSDFQNGLSGANSTVSSVAVQRDGKVLISGYFTTVNGMSRTNIARLNSDGSLDSEFQTQLVSVLCCGTVNSLAVQSDGKVLIGGYFTTVNGVSQTNVARLNTDGSLDTGFQKAVSWRNHVVDALAVQSDGKVLVGGFGSIVRLNSDGTLDSTFQNGFSATIDEVNSVAVQSNGKVLIGGHTFGPGGIARLNGDGTLDTGFRGFQNDLSGTDKRLTSVVVQSDGKVLVGGFFTMVNGVSRNRIARLNVDGTLDSGFQTELSEESFGVSAIAVQSDGKVVVGGSFTTVNGVSRTNIARLNSDGTVDTSFEGAFGGGVMSVAVQSDSKVLVGGQLILVNGLDRGGIARLNFDGSLDSGFQSGLAFGIVRSVAVQSDGKVLIGAEFMDFARLNADGNPDSDFQPGIDAVVRSIAVQSDGKVVVGGDFTTVKGVDRNRVARLNRDGTLDTSFQNGLSGVNGSVGSLAVQSDGKVLIGGSFTTVNGVGRTNIARLNADGTVDSGFQDGLSGTYGVSALAIQVDGNVLIGGAFTTVNGVPANGIARLWGNQPAYIESVSRPDAASATLTLRLQPGSTNRIEYKNDLTDPAWLDLPGDVIVSDSNSPTNKVDATLGAAQRRFYRVRQLP